MLKVFAIRDVKSEGFFPPVTAPTRGAAVRDLVYSITQSASPMSKYPEDYDLYELGEFNESTGELVVSPTISLVGNVSTFIQTLNKGVN